MRWVAGPLDPDRRHSLLAAGYLQSVRHQTDHDVRHGLQVALRGLRQGEHGDAA